MNTWSLSWHGLKTVVGLEVRQRLRSRKWIWALAIWFVFIGAITALVMWATYKSFAYSCDPAYQSCSLADSNAGPTAFSVVVLFVLGMGLVIAPAFTATSINGDRSDGILATLQATKLSALEIAGGKLVSAWLSAAVFLLVALPSIAASMILGSISVFQVLVCFAVIFVLVAIVCAIGLGWSAVAVRSAVSTVLTYLSVMVLSLISPFVLALTASFVEHEETVEVWGLTLDEQYRYMPEVKPSQYFVPPVDKCHWYTRTQIVTRTDKVWWILVPNPFVIVADAAPLSPKAQGDTTYSGDPLSALRATMRQMARPIPSPLEVDECWQLYNWSGYYEAYQNSDGTVTVKALDGTPVALPPSPVPPQPAATNYPVWPYGLAVNFIIGAAFFVVAVRRLRIPYRKLAKDTRVA